MQPLRNLQNLVFCACVGFVGFLCFQFQHGFSREAARLIVQTNEPFDSIDFKVQDLAETQPTLLAVAGQSAHASFLSASASGSPQIAWFSGTREGAKDVRIVQSTWTGATWSTPTTLVTRELLERKSLRHVRKLGNPVQHIDRRGIEHWFVVSVSLGGWAGARVEHWRAPKPGEVPIFHATLPVSPFLNISTLVRASAQNLADGGFVLPVYHEFLRKGPEILTFDANGNFVSKRRDFGRTGLLQPIVLPNAGKLPGWMLWYRDEDSRDGRLFNTRVNAGGTSTTQPTSLANRDTGIAAVNLPDGRILMAYNPNFRDTLRLATTRDGLSFTDAGLIAGDGASTKAVQAGAGDDRIEFSYPSLAVIGPDVWLSYTQHRKAIAVRKINWRALP